MKSLWIIAVLVFSTTIGSAEVYAPKARPVIPELILADGRAFKDAKILSDTAYTVSVAVSGKIIPVDKKLLPADLLAQWPIDEERAAKDKVAEQAAVEKRQAIAAKNKIAADQAKQEHIRDALAAAEKSKIANDTREAARAQAYDALKASRGGMEVRGVGSSFGSILILVRNISDGEVSFDWRALRYATKNGDVSRKFSTVVFDKDEVQDYVVKPHAQRVFLLRQVPVLEVSSVQWEDRKEVFAVRQLQRLRSPFDMRDHRMDGKILQKGDPLPNDDVTKILMAASHRYMTASLLAQ